MTRNGSTAGATKKKPRNIDQESECTESPPRHMDAGHGSTARPTHCAAAARNYVAHSRVQPSTNIVLFKYTTSQLPCLFFQPAVAHMLAASLPTYLHMRPLWSPSNPRDVTKPIPKPCSPTTNRQDTQSHRRPGFCLPYTLPTSTTGEILSTTKIPLRPRPRPPPRPPPLPSTYCTHTDQRLKLC